ncbi:MAG TPA: nucleotide exchange factor GrpE [Desulfobulbaceae bacterium]|nr:nucleotide exchange factor GrpE [Desulfobulbaceae bacterium]
MGDKRRGRKEKNINEEMEIPEDLGAVDEISDKNDGNTEKAADLQTELEQTKERMLRIAADAENYKKRMEREKEKMVKYAGENILRDLLPTVDNLERAMEQAKTETEDADTKLASMLEGIELTYKGLLSVLEKFNVTPIESVGKEFNPDEMDALTMEASDEVPANHVLREFAKGYRFKDRVLRHAQVVVSSGKDS